MSVKDRTIPADQYDLSKQNCSEQFLLKYLTSYLYKEVLTKFSIKYYLPEILADIFYFIYTLSRTTMYKLKDNLKAVNMSKYTGSNVKKCLQDINKCVTS